MPKGLSTNKPSRAVWGWLALGAAALLLLILFFASNTFKGFVEEATEWAEDLMGAHPVIGAWVFFLFSALSAMLAFASSIVLVPAANLAWGKIITFLLLWGGWVAGAVAAFGIGKLARPLLHYLINKEKLAEYQQFVSKRMKFWAVLLVCFAVPSEIPGYLFGSAHYSFLKFLGAIAIAEALYALGVIVAGENLLADRPLPVFIAISILATVAVGAALLLRVIKKRRLGKFRRVES
jgi:uncharacterized membrane protein YdjX (TVP38/TMEM64 family)